MTPQPSARAVAWADQVRAALAELVAVKRAHDRDGCDFPHLCPSRPVKNAIYDAGADYVEDLLSMAVVELAASNYRTTNQKGQTQ